MDTDLWLEVSCCCSDGVKGEGIKHENRPVLLTPTLYSDERGLIHFNTGVKKNNKRLFQKAKRLEERQSEEILAKVYGCSYLGFE